jgi:hypothetical protein
LPDASGTILTSSGTQAASFGSLTVDGNNISAVNSLGFRNRIINGNMVIDQRNAGASVTPTNTVGFTYTLDRWAAFGSVASRFSVQQDAGAVTPPVGFNDYLGVTSLSSNTVGSSETFLIGQFIEGFNTADLAWGTANAATVTLSFLIRSSITGTFGGVIQNSAQNRSYPFNYTISAANTWEQKTVTIAGDTSGTWLVTNGVGMRVFFSVGTGSALSGAANSWQSAALFSATGATSLVGTNGATFFITGVQLEVGSVATPFERRDYGRELMMCQRYYWNTGTGQGAQFGVQSTTTSGEFMFFHPVTMRAAPSLSYTSAANFASYLWNSGTSKTWTSAGSAFSTTRKCVAQISWSGASGLAGAAAGVDANNGDFLAFSAEL